MPTLTEIIFKGVASKIDFNFLSALLANSKETRFNAPEIVSSGRFEDVANILNSESYVDFVITANSLNVSGQFVRDVFINLGLNDGEVELLFYFNLEDVGYFSLKENIDHLRKWVERFNTRYNFERYICQMDNAGDEEYYFNENGLGPLYQKLSS
jgi:hypothetical protein